MATLEELRTKAHELEVKALEDAAEVQSVRNAYYQGLRGKALRDTATQAERRAHKTGRKRRLGGRERL